MRAHMVIYRDQWVFPDYLPLTDAINGWWQVKNVYMTAICDARLMQGGDG